MAVRQGNAHSLPHANPRVFEKRLPIAYVPKSDRCRILARSRWRHARRNWPSRASRTPDVLRRSRDTARAETPGRMIHSPLQLHLAFTVAQKQISGMPRVHTGEELVADTVVSANSSQARRFPKRRRISSLLGGPLAGNDGYENGGERVGASRRGKFEPGTKIRQEAANFEPGTDLRRAHGSGFSRVLGGPLAGNDG